MLDLMDGWMDGDEWFVSSLVCQLVASFLGWMMGGWIFEGYRCIFDVYQRVCLECGSGHYCDYCMRRFN